MAEMLPTMLGKNEKEIIVGTSKHFGGTCLLVVGDGKLYDWIEFTTVESAEKFRDALNEAINLHNQQNDEDGFFCITKATTNEDIDELKKQARIFKDFIRKESDNNG